MTSARAEPDFSVPRLLARLGQHLRPYRGKVALILVLLVVDAGFSSALALGVKFLIDRALVPKDWTLLVRILCLLAAGTALTCVTALTRDWLYAQVGSRVLYDLRLKLFERLHRLSAAFYAKANAGDLLARFSTDLAAVESAVSGVLPYGLMATLNIVISLVILFVLQWELALVTLLAVPLCAIGPRLVGPRAAAAGYRLRQEEAGVAEAVDESVHGHAVVRAFDLAKPLRDSFTGRLARVLHEARRFNFLSGVSQRLPILAVDVVHLAVLAVGAVMAFRGALTIGSLVSFDLVFLNFAAGVGSLSDVVPNLLRAAGGMRRIDELLDEEETVKDPERPEPLAPLANAISFRDVSFGYDAERLDLASVSFDIPRGANVAFVGRSGSGKSTVLSLLLRFHDPRAGSIAWDRTDLRRVRQTDLRARIGAVFQESFLFDGTVRENVLVGRPDATAAQFDAASRAAELTSFVPELPQGYDTPLGERGGRLSGGQRQRVALARALVRDPEVLVLDEATSALDAATESAVDRAIVHAGRGRTVVSVTHRLTSVVGADRIFVMDGGRLVEEGRHDELLRRDGMYAALWRRQQGFHVGADGATAAVNGERLRLIPLFQGLDATLLDEVARRFVAEPVPALRTVIEEGDPGDRFHLIVRGRVAVSRKDTAGVPRTIAVLETGDHFGEVALLHDVPRTATVRTLTPCLLLTLARAPFLELVDRAPGLRASMQAVVDTRVAAERANRLEDAASAG